MLSGTALAWPMVSPVKAHSQRSESLSIGGRRMAAEAGRQRWGEEGQEHDCGGSDGAGLRGQSGRRRRFGGSCCFGGLLRRLLLVVGGYSGILFLK